MQWRIGWRAGLALALALTLSACGGAAVRKAPSSPQAKAPSSAQRDSVPRLSGPMRVAVLVPLTGEFASIGQQFVNAATIAVFEDQQEPFELIPFDTKGTPDGARDAAAAALREQVDMVIGPLFGRHVPVVRQTLQARNIAILTLTNDTDQAGGNVFVMGVSISDQIERLAQALARDNRGRLLIFGPDTPYTQLAISTVQAMSDRGQIQLVRAATFSSGTDFNQISEQVKALTEYDRRRGEWRAYEARLVPQVRQASDPAGFLAGQAAQFPEGSVRNRMLRGMASVYNQHRSRGRNAALSEVISRIEGVDASPADDFDAVLLPFADDNLIAVGSMLDLYNAGYPFARLVGTNFWAQQDLAKEPSFHHGWFSSLDQAAIEPFILSYTTTYQSDPDSIAVLGYYGGRVGILAAKQNIRPVTPAFVRRPEGFGGQAGNVRFGPDNVMRHPLKVYQVTPDGPRELDAETGPTS